MAARPGTARVRRVRSRDVQLLVTLGDEVHSVCGLPSWNVRRRRVGVLPALSERKVQRWEERLVPGLPAGEDQRRGLLGVRLPSRLLHGGIAVRAVPSWLVLQWRHGAEDSLQAQHIRGRANIDAPPAPEVRLVQDDERHRRYVALGLPLRRWVLLERQARMRVLRARRQVLQR